MLNRQFIPPLRTSATAVDGTVLARPASRLFTETRPGQVMEPLVKSPVGFDQETGSGPGSAPPEGGQAGSEGNLLDATTRDGSQDEVPEAAEAGALVATDAVVADLAAADLIEGAPDLSGYGAYGNTPTPVASLSRD